MKASEVVSAGKMLEDATEQLGDIVASGETRTRLQEVYQTLLDARAKLVAAFSQAA